MSERNWEKCYAYWTRNSSFVEGKIMLRDRWHVLILILLDMSNFRLSDKTDILEVGCGTGGLSIWASHESRSVTGLDVTKRAISFANTLGKKTLYGGRLNFAVGDGRFLPFQDGLFDLCICSETFEHVPNYEKLFDELIRTTKNSGYIIVTVPNYVNITQTGIDGPTKYVWQFLNKFRGSQPTDLNKFSIFTLKKIFESRGLRIVAMRGMGLLVIHFARISNFQRIFDRPFNKFLSLNIGVIAQKAT